MKDHKEFREHWVSFRRDLHRYPELSWEETRTGDRICRELDRMGVSYRRGLAKTGIVADIGDLDGGRPRVALRADMDALPIQEETGLAFASEREGVMHACGHDGHVTMVLEATERLAREKELPAPVRILFQPAEEKGAGAKAMIEAGALQDVAMIFGGHVDRQYHTGQIVTHAGAVNASTDNFRIEIRGKGGHAARPHECIDSVVVGSFLVTAIQTIVSREIHPAHPAVITVGRFEAGTASNVIAAGAVLEGTIRAQETSVREQLIESLRRIVSSLASLHQAHIAIDIRPGTPPVINPPEMAALAREAASEVVGPENAVSLDTANMGGEDFAYYLQRIPGCYVRLGAVPEGQTGHPAHSSKFDIDEAVLPIGAEYFYRVVKKAGERLATGKS